MSITAFPEQHSCQTEAKAPQTLYLVRRNITLKQFHHSSAEKLAIHTLGRVSASELTPVWRILQRLSEVLLLIKQNEHVSNLLGAVVRLYLCEL